MSNVTDSSSVMNETLMTSTMKSNDAQNKILIIVLSVVLPTVSSLVLLSLFIVCYRRRLAKLWLKKHSKLNRFFSDKKCSFFYEEDNAGRLESFDSNYNRPS